MNQGYRRGQFGRFTKFHPLWMCLSEITNEASMKRLRTITISELTKGYSFDLRIYSIFGPI